MACSVDPFSITTAELSHDYMKVFPNPHIIPKYLEEVSDRTGAVVLAVDDCISIKGSWVSLKRVRSFLSEFLASYKVAESEEDKKDVDPFDGGSPLFSNEDDSNNEEDLQQLNSHNVARFHEATEEPSDWLKWTAEVLPQIQPIRSKRACEYSQPQSEANKIPEPLVLYANYQPAPDPAAKVPPTLEAIEKVLKTVYDTSKPKTSKFSECVPTSVISNNPASNEPTDSQKVNNEKCAELKAQNIAGAINHTQTGVTFSDHNTVEHKPDQSDTTLCSNTLKDLGSLSAEADASIFSPSTDAVRNTGSPLYQPPHEDLEKKKSSQSCSGHAGEGEEVAKQRGRKAKDKADSLTDGDVLSETKLTNKSPSCMTDSGVKETRRKGRPRKNIRYKSETPDSKTQSYPENQPSRAEKHKSAKRRSMTHKKNVLPEPSPLLDVKKKPGRSQQSIVQDVTSQDEGKGYICELCPYIAKKFSHLREHKRRVHITKGKEFKCEECGKIFGFAKDLKRHYLTHQKAENCCDVCGKMYKGVRNLAEHKKTHETNYVKPEFPCEFCQKIFSTKYVLAYHVKSEHLGMKKTYLCPTCGKSFSQKNSYLQHANVHMGIKPYQCDTCGKSFSYEKSLKEHKYMHQDDKQFECPVCHKKFRQSSGVAIHMKIHKERKDYVCSACGKGFSQKQAMIRHERIHVGEKPFACSLCKRSFSDSSILRRHMILIHKKDKDKWREDTENNVQRRTDFFISVVKDGMLEKDQTVRQDVGDLTAANNENCSLQALADNSAPLSTSYGDESKSCHTKDDRDFSVTPVGIGTLISVSQMPSSLESVIPAMPSLSHHPHYSDVRHEPSDSVTMPMDSIIHDSFSTVQSAVQKLEPETVYGMSLQPSLSTPSSSQTVHLSSQNENQNSLQQETLCVPNSYTFSEPSCLSSSDVCAADLQQSTASSTHTTDYPVMVGHGSADYHPNMVMMSDAIASLEFHSRALNIPPSSQEQTADCEGLIPGSSVLQQ